MAINIRYRLFQEIDVTKIDWC